MFWNKHKNTICVDTSELNKLCEDQEKYNEIYDALFGRSNIDILHNEDFKEWLKFYLEIGDKREVATINAMKSLLRQYMITSNIVDEKNELIEQYEKEIDALKHMLDRLDAKR